MLLSLGLPADAAAAHRHDFTSVPLSAKTAQPLSTVFAMPTTMMAPHRRLVLDGRRPSSVDVASTPSSSPEEGGGEDTSSESGRSRARSSDEPGTPRGGPGLKPPPRSKTSFHLAHPAPSFINRPYLPIRPRLLLQLQRISGGTRPSPALDVLPSSILPAPLGRRLPGVFRGKDRLGPDDLVIVNSDGYDTSFASPADHVGETDADGSESRHVVATICQRRKDDDGVHARAEISISDGRLWEAKCLPTGGYEFTAQDERGRRTTVRWVPRPSSSSSRRRSTNSHNRAHTIPGRDDRKFSFSLINPNVRRHPIIASLTRTAIDVFDAYPTSAPSTTTDTPLATPHGSTPSRTSFFDSPPDGAVTQTDDALRTVILVTGIWVAFCEGLFQGSRHHGATAFSPHSTLTNTSASSASPRSDSSPAARDGKPRLVCRRSVPDPPNLDTQWGRTTNGVSSPPLTPARAPVPGGGNYPLPRRAHSTGSSSRLPANGSRRAVSYQVPQAVSSALAQDDEVSPPPTSKLMPQPDVNGRGRAQKSSASEQRRGPSLRKPAAECLGSRGRGGAEDQRGKVSPKKRWGRIKSLLKFIRKSRSRR